ncbi:MAG TPA: hypothetical protein VFV35_06295 [Acidimicrobiales bacterium]|nr:hypothetical protein [Acidimicrobiales bacterium]
MPTKRLVGAAAFTAALAAGGAAGALLGTPVLSGAQEDSTTTTDDPTVATGAAPRRLRPGARGENLSTAAEALGMTAGELRAELAEGKSIADVAAEKGVDKQKVIDALVAEATARIAELVERDGLPAGGHHGPGRPGGLFRGVVDPLDDAATALGIPAQELRDELASGASIASIAEERGKNLDEVKAAMVADATARIDQALANGRLTEAQAAELEENLADKVDRLVQQEGLPLRGRHGRGPADAGEDSDGATPEGEGAGLSA